MTVLEFVASRSKRSRLRGAGNALSDSNNGQPMRHSWKTSPVTVVFIELGAVLLGLAVFGYAHGQHHRQYLVSAVTCQMDAHFANIATLLSEAGSRTASQLEDAAYAELQRAPSTSLITRGMVSVRQSTGSGWECVIDTKSFGLQAQRIQQATVGIPTP